MNRPPTAIPLRHVPAAVTTTQEDPDSTPPILVSGVVLLEDEDEEDSMNSYGSDEEDEEGEEVLPSKLTYKNQGREVSDVLTAAATSNETTNEGDQASSVRQHKKKKKKKRHSEERMHGEEVLPSTLTYKDQGRNVSEILAARPTRTTTTSTTTSSPGTDPLPSQLSYKDQGRDPASVWGAVHHPQASANRYNQSLPSPVNHYPPINHYPPANYSQPASIANNYALAPVNNNNNPSGNHPSRDDGTSFRRLLSKIKCTLATAIVLAVLIVVAAIVLVVVFATNGRDDNETTDREADALFDGTARLFLVLYDLTTTMSDFQLSWFLLTLATVLEEVTINQVGDVVPSLETGWTAVLEEQQVVIIETSSDSNYTRKWQKLRELQASSSAVAMACTLDIPFDTAMAETNPLQQAQVERLLQNMLQNNQELFLSRLADIDSTSTRAYFEQVSQVVTYPSDTDVATIDGTTTNLEMPTVSPREAPALGPPPAPVPPTTYGVFEDPEELRLAVLAYAADNSPGSTVAETYGHPIGTWDVSRITYMSCMFYAITDSNSTCTGATSILVPEAARLQTFNEDISGWSTGQVTTTSSMFEGAIAFNQPLDTWNVAQVTDMGWMFLGTLAFNQPLDTWNVAQVTDMEGMFAFATAFNQPLDTWNVAQVTTMGVMFSGATAFNQPLDTWNVAQVTDMAWMFTGTDAFNQPLDTWDVAQVTDMEGMFAFATAFNQPLDTWNVAQVTNMRSMFYSADAFNQPLDTWDVAQVTDMELMFYSAIAFNQPLATWNVAQVTNMEGMFSEASAFNQNLCAWGLRLPSSTDVDRMFKSANSCPNSVDTPDLSANPPGPFCYTCS